MVSNVVFIVVWNSGLIENMYYYLGDYIEKLDNTFIHQPYEVVIESWYVLYIQFGWELLQ